MAAKRSTTKKRAAKVKAPAVPEVPEVAAAPMTSLVRDATALRVLDLTLAAMERRLIKEPDALTSASIGAVSRLLALYFKERQALDDGSAQRAEHARMLSDLGDLPAFADEDKDDPMLQGPDGYNTEAPVVSPEDIAALATFKD